MRACHEVVCDGTDGRPKRHRYADCFKYGGDELIVVMREGSAAHSTDDDQTIGKRLVDDLSNRLADALRPARTENDDPALIDWGEISPTYSACSVHDFRRLLRELHSTYEARPAERLALTLDHVGLGVGIAKSLGKNRTECLDSMKRIVQASLVDRGRVKPPQIRSILADSARFVMLSAGKDSGIRVGMKMQVVIDTQRASKPQFLKEPRSIAELEIEEVWSKSSRGVATDISGKLAVGQHVILKRR